MSQQMYKNQNIFICHWWVRSRTDKKLNFWEEFHINCHKFFNISEIFSEIHIALNIDDDISDEIIDYIKQKYIDVIGGNIIFHTSSNAGLDGEYFTFHDIVLPYLKTDNHVFYCHFKGMSHMKNDFLNIGFWSFLMYYGCLSNECFQEKNIAFSKKNIAMFGAYRRLSQTFNYLTLYGLPPLQQQHFFYTGSFQWINCDTMRQLIQDKGLNIDFFITHQIENIANNRTRYFFCETIFGFFTQLEQTEIPSIFNNLEKISFCDYKLYESNIYCLSKYKGLFNQLIKKSTQPIIRTTTPSRTSEDRMRFQKLRVRRRK